MSRYDASNARSQWFTQALGDRYALEGELGSGGTATIFLATELKYQRRVAIKVFRAEVAEAVGHERFVREIGYLATLNHPHIVPLLDSGEAGEMLYYVMPAVEGESLRHRLEREGWLPVDEAIQIARDVAVALDYAHGRGIVHRDIKPENILLSGGTAVVADFGIAKMVNRSNEITLTRAGTAVGTVLYMSPEQAAGGAVDPRTDVYSLGCVLFEMLGAKAPFAGTSLRQVVMALAAKPVPSLHAVRPEVTPAMDRVLAKAMAKIPDERYPSATAFVDEMIATRQGTSREVPAMGAAAGGGSSARGANLDGHPAPGARLATPPMGPGPYRGREDERAPAAEGNGRSWMIGAGVVAAVVVAAVAIWWFMSR